jgi:VIT1/CCC1 family predicted Fe2+/Mn2+ transporter
MPDELTARPGRVLEPMERISEILFGVIMALTFTCTLGVEIGDQDKVRTMLIGALGCNLAWGIIDAGVYLLTQVNNESRKIATLRAIREAGDRGTVRGVIAAALNPLLASTLTDEQLDSIRQKLLQLPKPPERARLTQRDWRNAKTVCALSFISTLPIALPFLFIDHARLALRVSNGIAVAMLALCGYAFGYRSGLSPWATSLVMVAFGAAMVGVAIALGG